MNISEVQNAAKSLQSTLQSSLDEWMTNNSEIYVNYITLIDSPDDGSKYIKVNIHGEADNSMVTIETPNNI